MLPVDRAAAQASDGRYQEAEQRAGGCLAVCLSVGGFPLGARPLTPVAVAAAATAACVYVSIDVRLLLLSNTMAERSCTHFRSQPLPCTLR